MSPGYDEGRPGQEAPSNVVNTDLHRLRETADRIGQPLPAWRSACPCGCGDADECLAGRPIARPAAWCCLTLGWEELETARLNGWNCQRACVAQRLGVVA